VNTVAPIMAQSDYTYTGDADAFLKAFANRLDVK
jgi:electron transfer flavoprotein alpha subunit